MNEEIKYNWIIDTNEIIEEVTTVLIQDNDGNKEHGIVLITSIGDIVLGKSELEQIVMLLEEDEQNGYKEQP